MKPNQIVDPILNVVYPPPEAILPQLNTIKTLAASTARVYEATEDIRSIMPNLDMLQTAINYLRGAPAPEQPSKPPEETFQPDFYVDANGVTVSYTFNENGEYDVSVVALSASPHIINPELFGDIDFDAIELDISFPVICGKNYLISQSNPILEHYQNDPYVGLYDNEWIKEKEYLMDEDAFTYAFLLGKGRTKVKIAVYADYEEPIIFNITSHIHFVKPEEPPVTVEPEPAEGEAE